MKKTPSLFEDSTFTDFHCYLPVSNSDFTRGIYCTTIGNANIAPENPYPPSDHPSLYRFSWNEGRMLPELVINYIFQGEGEFETKTSDLLPVRAGQVIVVQVGEWHRYRPLHTTGWAEMWLHIGGVTLRQNEELGILTLPSGVYTPQEPELFDLNFKRLIQKAKEGDASLPLNLVRGAIGLFSHLRLPQLTEKASPESSHADPVLQSALQFIWEHSHRVIGIPDVVSHSGVSRRTLERRFDKILKKSILGVLTDCRCRRAALCLRNTTLPIGQVARLTGFGSQETMRQAFMQSIGISPMRYRKTRTVVYPENSLLDK